MIRFREIEKEDAKKILDWRTSERVTKFMNSDMKYDLDGQTKWLAGSFNKSNYYHWIIQYDGNDVGLLNFVDWDDESKTTSWGFYIGEDDALGVGGIVPLYFYNFAFDVLGVDRVFAEVFYNNTGVIELHLNQGYCFDTERDYVIKKNGKDILMVCMFLDRRVFKDSKLSRLKQDLPIDRWQACPL
jgi:UDP-4-amino-4,6-dideoxy-N-acetyl-beta-L-altrosamine N-acetyltransferase